MKNKKNKKKTFEFENFIREQIINDQAESKSGKFQLII